MTSWLLHSLPRSLAHSQPRDVCSLISKLLFPINMIMLVPISESPTFSCAILNQKSSTNAPHFVGSVLNAPEIDVPRAHHAQCTLGGGRIFVSGGFAGGQHLTTTTILDLISMQWSKGCARQRIPVRALRLILPAPGLSFQASDDQRSITSLLLFGERSCLRQWWT